MVCCPELVAMSTKEIDRLDVIRRVLERGLKRRKAAELLGITSRQVRRLCKAFERDGAAGLVSKRRGKRSNRRLPDEVQRRAVDIVRGLYADFGPTLAREKLIEVHGVRVAKETLRKWMVAAGLWMSREERIPKPHQPRYRRACLGELVQIDGCEHHWFEDRGPPCSLLVYVDDATSRVMELRFARAESTFDYFAATASYLRRHGKPVAFYSDKHSIFRVAREGTTGARPRRDPVRARSGRVEHRHHLRQLTPGKGPGRAHEFDAPGPFGKGASTAQHRHHGRRQPLLAHLHGGPKPPVCKATSQSPRCPSAC
jgi:transposase